MIYRLLLFIGIIPLLLPFVLGMYHVFLESWNLLDWLILYSYVYYPTYIIGIILILFSLYKLKEK